MPCLGRVAQREERLVEGDLHARLQQGLEFGLGLGFGFGFGLGLGLGFGFG